MIQFFYTNVLIPVSSITREINNYLPRVFAKLPTKIRICMNTRGPRMTNESDVIYNFHPDVYFMNQLFVPAFNYSKLYIISLYDKNPCIYSRVMSNKYFTRGSRSEAYRITANSSIKDTSEIRQIPISIIPINSISAQYVYNTSINVIFPVDKMNHSRFSDIMKPSPPSYLRFA